jgi:hypothetical protein
MPSFSEHNVEATVSIHITDADVGRGVGGRLKEEATIEAWEARSHLSLLRIALSALNDLTTRR